MPKSCPGEDEWLPTSHPDFYPFLGMVGLLVLVGGIMSGLQQGLMQIDRPGLKTFRENASPVFIYLSSYVELLINRRHLTLVTLLISNAAAMEALPIFFDVLVPKYFAILFSVSLLLIFGEIIPQALCLRYPGELACIFAPFVYALMILFYPIAYPIARFLDWLLGAEHTKYYTRVGLLDLAQEQRSQLSVDELDVITGALELWDKHASDIWLPLDRVFKLSYNTILTDKVFRSVLEHGHSRVPIWKDSEDNIIGLLLVKHLIRVNPEDNISVSDLQIMPLFNIDEHMSLFALLRKFQTGASHMAVVSCFADSDGRARSATDQTQNTSFVRMTSAQQKPIKALGIITLEDIIEKLIKRDIEDETDVWKPFNQRLDSRMNHVRQTRDSLLETLERGGIHAKGAAEGQGYGSFTANNGSLMNGN